MGIEDFLRMMRMKQGERSLREFALSLGVSAAYLSDIYLRNRNPGQKIAKAMGYTLKKTRRVTCVFTPLS